MALAASFQQPLASLQGDGDKGAMTHDAPATDLLKPTRNCWRIAEADKVAVIIDADEYFRVARAAMCRAKRRIMMVGWDFDARLVLDRSHPAPDGPAELGAFFQWLVAGNPELEIFLLRWDIGALKTFLRAKTLWLLTKWVLHPRISFHLDHHHPIAGSHHQKIVVIDDCLAFCGGIDMTGDRWDTPQHREADPRRCEPNGRPYGPWHDATTALQGPAAAALGDLCRARWRDAGRGDLAPITGVTDVWPDGLTPHFEKVPVAISRTFPPMPRQAAVDEIEGLYVDLIASARHFVYAESQYFASRRIAIAIAGRLDEPDGPEFVIVNPLTAEGWLEPMAMDTARGRLVEALKRRDTHGRFRIYHPTASAGTPIYVHAKILVVDDRIIRIGSSNMNNRSLRLDTECDLTIDANFASGSGSRVAIAAIRTSLLAEHLGVGGSEIIATLAETGSLIATVERLRRPAGRTLQPYVTPGLSGVEQWLADNEILDPEGPDEMFEPLAHRGLFRGWHKPHVA